MGEMRDDLARELQRVVDRLGNMPLTRAQDFQEQVQSAAAYLVNVGGERSADDLPRLQPHGLSSLIAVVGRDYLNTPRNDERDQQVLDLLIALRRALP